MTIVDRLRNLMIPVAPAGAAATPAAPPAPAADQAGLHAQVARLSGELAATKSQLAAEKRRTAALEDELRERRVATAGSLRDELIRARRTLRDYEDQLAVCRDKHRWNIRGDEPHHPLAWCVFCGQPVPDPLAPCGRAACQLLEAAMAARQARLNADPDIRDETRAKRQEDA